MREAVILASLLTFVSAHPEGGYSYDSPSSFYRASIPENNGNNFVVNSFTNGYSYSPPTNVYRVPDTGRIISNYLPPDRPVRPRPSVQNIPIPDPLIGRTFTGGNNELDQFDIGLVAKRRNPTTLIGGTRLQQVPEPIPPVPQVPQISTSVYAYLAPKEPELPTPPEIVPLPQPKINYKIIFIKAPAPPIQSVPVIPPIKQDQEKTIIYVLVKRPEEAPEITIPTVAPTAPTKPEVYFIRYKTQKKTEVGGGRTETVDTKYGPPGYSGPY